MNKLMPVIFLSVMALMVVMAWSNIAGFKSEIKMRYDNFITQAEEKEKKGIYVEAVKNLEQAYAIQSNYDMAMHMADLYLALDQSANANGAFEKALSVDPTRKEPYLRLADSYRSEGNSQDLYKLLIRAKENASDTKEIDEMLDDILNSYNTNYFEFDEFEGWYTLSDGSVQAIVKKDDKLGIINAEADTILGCNYTTLGLMLEGVAPVNIDGECYYINGNGYKLLVPESKAEYLGSFTSKYAPAKINGKYGYIDMSMQETHFDYDYAGCFSSGLAAVQKTGKWAVINENFAEITGYDFDEVVMDNYDVCSRFGVFFAKKDNKYTLYNNQGQPVSDSYDEVKLFASGEPAAVRKGKKWGFINTDGSVAIKPEYDDADSFNLGYAPVCKDGKWAFINKDNKSVIDLDMKKVYALGNNAKAFAIDNDDRAKYVEIKVY